MSDPNNMNMSLPTPNFQAFNDISGYSPSFLETNSLIAKFAFIILVLIVFVFILRFGVSLINWFLTPKNNPILLDGMINAKQMVRIPQDPSVKGAKPITRSQNERDGLEFTWAVWLYVDDFTYKQDQFKHVFHKGNDDINLTKAPIGQNYPNNGPGLYITPDVNNLVVIMNTFDSINEEVMVRDLPLHKWVHVVIRVTKQNQLDVYINGTLAKRHILSSVPKQNYGDVFVSMNGGFSGYSSDLRYFDKAIGTAKIQDLLHQGPNLKLLGGDQMQGSRIPSYLSSRWYFRSADEI
jgi:hypothetical protein